MNIQPIQYNNISMYGAPKKPSGWKKLKDKAIQYVVDKFPEKTFSDTADEIKKRQDIEKFISRPAQNRAIVGATALITQPVIDSCNPKVDKETRVVSRNRTIAKIIAGTSVGMVVRGLAYKLVECMTQLDGTTKNSQRLLPKKYIREMKEVTKFFNTHKSGIATVVALLAMLITNFAIDAPLTTYLTNKFNAKSMKKAVPKEIIGGTNAN